MIELSIDKKVQVEVHITDRGGNPAPVDGIPTWASSDENLVTVEPEADGMSAWVIAGDTADEVATVEVEIDADVGEGVRPIIGVLTVALTGGEARFVELRAAGEPVDKD